MEKKKKQTVADYPELVKEWHPKNIKKPKDYPYGSHKKVWWKCPEGDDHEWEAEVKSRTRGNGCPHCYKHTTLRDLTGQMFGLLTVVDRAKNKDKRTMWNCICKCGNKKVVRSDSLTSGRTKSCFCQYTENLTGQKFERLTVISRAKNGKHENARWNCICICGAKKIVYSHSLKSGNTRSCKCLLSENIRKGYEWEKEVKNQLEIWFPTITHHKILENNKIPDFYLEINNKGVILDAKFNYKSEFIKPDNWEKYFGHADYFIFIYEINFPDKHYIQDDQYSNVFHTTLENVKMVMNDLKLLSVGLEREPVKGYGSKMKALF